MVQSLYNKYDKPLEEMIGGFLDEHFYNDESIFTKSKYKATRMEDKDLQKRGIDVTVERLDKESITRIDEKAAIHHINAGLQTFAFEITGTGGNPGWLVKDGIDTDFYLLAWIYANKEKYPVNKLVNQKPPYYENFKIEDLDYISCCLLQKNAIITFLKDRGFDKRHLLVKAGEMIGLNCEYDGTNKKEGFYFRFSRQLAERPVNVVIYKNVLKELATIQNICFCYRIDFSGSKRTNKLL